MVIEVSATLVEKDHLSSIRRANGSVLRGGGKLAVQRSKEKVTLGGERRRSVHRFADFGSTGQKDQNVSADFSGQELPHRRHHLRFERTIIRRGCILDGHLEELAFARDDGHVAEVSGDRGGVERGRHHHDLQIGPRGLAESPQQREGQIALQMTLVKLIEHDRSNPAQQRIADWPARQNALGHELQSRRASHHPLETDLVPDHIAHLFAPFLGHATSRKASS